MLTFLAEAIGIGIAFKVSPLMVLEMAFDFDFYSIRPGWFVLAAGLVVIAVDLRARPDGAAAPRVGVTAAASPPPRRG